MEDHRVVLGADATSARKARQFVSGVFLTLGIQPPAEVALLTSELASNAIIHAATDFTVSVAAGPKHVRVEVEDGDDRRPAPRHESASATSGRGLQLVEALATTWGIRPQGTGKAVWFELTWA